MNKNRYAFLDGIRGMAAILVAIRHTPAFWNLHIHHSYLAVDLFFLLSGFVIASAYDSKLLSGAISFRQFVIIRLIRFYPIFLFSIILCSILFVGKLLITHQVINVFDVAGLMIMTFIFMPYHWKGSEHLFPLNNPYWSLFYELIVNIAYARARVFLTDFNLMLLVAISCMLLIFVSYKSGGGLDYGSHWGGLSMIIGGTRAVFGIGLGLLMFRCRIQWKAKIGNLGGPWLACAVIILCLILPSFGSWDWLVDIVAIMIIFPLTVFVASEAKVSQFESYLLALGAASYPLYLLHIPISRLLQMLIKGKETALAPYSGVLLTVVLVLFSIWLEKKYDIPFRKVLTKYFLKTK